jgi:hypothetical protein
MLWLAHAQGHEKWRIVLQEILIATGYAKLFETKENLIFEPRHRSFTIPHK